MAAAHPPSRLYHWDGSSCVGLLISVLTHCPAAFHSLLKLLHVFVVVHARLCLRKLLLQVKTFQVVQICVMHVVAIPDHKTQISCLHNLYCLTFTLSQTHKVLRHANTWYTQRDLNQLTLLSLSLINSGCSLNNVLFGNNM